MEVQLCPETGLSPPSPLIQKTVSPEGTAAPPRLQALVAVTSAVSSAKLTWHDVQESR